MEAGTLQGSIKRLMEGTFTMTEFIQLADLRMSQLVIEVDATEDAYDRPPVTQPGWQKLRLGVNTSGEGYIATVRDSNNNNQLIGYRLHCVATVVDGPDKDNDILFWPSSINRKGKKTNEVATLLSLAGVQLPPSTTQEQLIQALIQKMNQGLVLYGQVDWRGAIKDDKGDYNNVFTSFNDFDRNPTTGRYIDQKMYTDSNGKSQIVYAQCNIRKFTSKDPRLNRDDGEVSVGGFDPTRVPAPMAAPAMGIPGVPAGPQPNGFPQQPANLGIAPGTGTPAFQPQFQQPAQQPFQPMQGQPMMAPAPTMASPQFMPQQQQPMQQQPGVMGMQDMRLDTGEIII